MTGMAKGLYIDVSSSDIFQIRRAFVVGTMVRNNHKLPVTVDLSLGAVRFVNKALPLAAEHIKIYDKTLHDYITTFMEAGGLIVVCPVSLQGEGLTSDDLLEGINVADHDAIVALMLEQEIKILSF